VVGVVVTFARMQGHARHRHFDETSRVFTADREDGQPRIRFEGALDALTVRDVRPMIDALIAGHPQKVTLDLDLVTRIDSTGVGAIVSLFKRVKAQGGEVVVVHAHDQPLAVLQVLKLDAVFGL
jgi:anti-sigma B factor antagonist